MKDSTYTRFILRQVNKIIGLCQNWDFDEKQKQQNSRKQTKLRKRKTVSRLSSIHPYDLPRHLRFLLQKNQYNFFILINLISIDIKIREESRK